MFNNDNSLISLPDPESRWGSLCRRFVDYGFNDFSQEEILETLLFFVDDSADMGNVAERLIKKYSSLFSVVSAPLDELQNFEGLDFRSAAFLKSLFSICQVYGTFPQESRPLLDTDFAVKLYAERFCGKEDKNVLIIIGVNDGFNFAFIEKYPLSDICDPFDAAFKDAAVSEVRNCFLVIRAEDEKACAANFREKAETACKRFKSIGVSVKGIYFLQNGGFEFIVSDNG